MQYCRRVNFEPDSSRDATLRSVCIQTAETRTPTTLERSTTCNFHCGDAFALRRSTSDEARRRAKRIKPAPHIDIRLYQIISDYIRSSQIISDYPTTRPTNPTELHEDRAGPDGSRQTCRRGSLSPSNCLPQRPWILAWHGFSIAQTTRGRQPLFC